MVELDAFGRLRHGQAGFDGRTSGTGVAATSGGSQHARGFKSRRGGLRWPIKLGYRGQTTPKSRYVDLIERRNVRARPTLPTPEVNRALNIATSHVSSLVPPPT